MTAAEQRTTTGLYAYGFLPASTRLPDALAGVGRRTAPVGLIAHNGLAVLASDVDLDELAGLTEPEVLDRDALAGRAQEHDRVVRAAFEHEPVLPFRFGTVLADLTAAVRLLADRQDRVTELLRRITGHREWGVRLRQADDTPDVPAPAEPDRSSGAAYLAGRRKQLTEFEQRSAATRALAADLADRLAGCATESVDRPGGAAVLDVALLVPRGAEDDLLRRAAECTARAVQGGLELDLTGPWPPYSFARAWEGGDD
jgi:Gas vesicle synthesis protein GvpL/GvpF